MLLKDRLVIVGESIAAALLIGISWMHTALAAGGLGDGDGPDADEVAWPWLALGGLVLIGVVAFFMVKSRVRAQLCHC